MKDRDITILTKIVQYADEINGTVSRFNLDLEKFESDYIVKMPSQCVYCKSGS